jgi:hypothetical protein
MDSMLAASESGGGVQARPPVSEHAYGRALLTPVRELRGVVERITYNNPDNGYTVARLAPERMGLEARSGQGR